MYIEDEHSQNYVSKLYEYMVFVMIIQWWVSIHIVFSNQ